MNVVEKIELPKPTWSLITSKTVHKVHFSCHTFICTLCIEYPSKIANFHDIYLHQTNENALCFLYRVYLAIIRATLSELSMDNSRYKIIDGYQ